MFDELKDFISTKDESEFPVIRLSEKEFTVSYESTNDKEIHTEEIIEEVLENDESTEIAEDTSYELSYDEENIHEEDYIEEEILEAVVEDQSPIQPSTVKEKRKSVHSVRSTSRKNPTGFNFTACNSCNVTFKDFKYFSIHEKAHENYAAISSHLEMSNCNIDGCRMVFSNVEDLRIHMNAHSEGDNIVTITKNGAYADILLPMDERQFEDNIGNSDDFKVCGHCSRKYNEQDMKVHQIFFHTTSIICPIDNRMFQGRRQVRAFSEHIRNKHPEIFDDPQDLYVCRLCNASFDSNFQKLAHMKKCDAKMFECSGHCNKKFATQWLLKAHLKNLEDDRFVCDICSKKCVSRSDLKIHQRCHTNERPFQCSFCLKSFKTQANRSSHMDIHEPVKKHDCEICGKKFEFIHLCKLLVLIILGEKFQTRPILRKHKKKHDKNYTDECSCKICNHLYISKPHLIRHLKSVHKAPKDLKSTDMEDYWNSILKK